VNFTVFVNDSAGNSNSTARRFVTFDNTTLGLVNWNYSFTTKTLNLTFNQTVDIRFVNVSSLSITDNDSIVPPEFMVSGLAVFNKTAPTVAGNGKIVTIPVIDAFDGWIRDLDGCSSSYNAPVGRLILHLGFVRGLGGNNVTVVSGQGYQNLTRYSLEVETCSALAGEVNNPQWHVIQKLSAIRIGNISSLNSNFTAQNVLSSIAGNYTAVFTYNTSQGAWTSFVLGNTASTIITIGSVDQPYHIRMNVTDKIQIA